MVHFFACTKHLSPSFPSAMKVISLLLAATLAIVVSASPIAEGSVSVDSCSCNPANRRAAWHPACCIASIEPKTMATSADPVAEDSCSCDPTNNRAGWHPVCCLTAKTQIAEMTRDLFSSFCSVPFFCLSLLSQNKIKQKTVYPIAICLHQ